VAPSGLLLVPASAPTVQAEEDDDEEDEGADPNPDPNGGRVDADKRKPIGILRDVFVMRIPVDR
jgi:hypothetical protein